MKKLLKSLIGMSLLCVGMFSVLHENKENNIKVTHAEECDRVTDVISVDTIKASGVTINATSYNFKTLKTNFINEYGFDTKLGSNSSTSNIQMVEKSKCLYMESGDFGSHPVGFMSKKRVGYIRSISIAFADYSILEDDFNPINVYLSNHDEEYQYPINSSAVVYQSYINDFAYQFTFDKLDENYTDTVTFEDSDYKYVGLIVDGGQSARRLPSYIKSITIEWELHDFTSVINCDMSTDGVSLVPNETYQIPTPETSGNGKYTNDKVIYSVADTGIATVDENGLVTAVGFGHTTIKMQYGTDFIFREIFIMNPVYLAQPTNASRIEKTDDLQEGDMVLFVFEDGENSKILSAISYDGDIGIEADCIVDESNHTLSNFKDGELFYVFGNEQENYAFKSLTNEFLAYNVDAGEGEYGLYNKGDAIDWNVTISDGVASIKNIYNPEKSFYYDSEYCCFDVMTCGDSLAIYKIDCSGGLSGIMISDISNGSSPALNFAEMFLEEMSHICDYNGVGTDKNALLEKWIELFSTETNEFNDLTFKSKLMFRCAEANPNGDSIQKALYLYEYIIGKYEGFDSYNYFNRTIPLNAARFIPGSLFNSEDDGTLLCVLSLSCLTLLTSVLYLYKKKKSL